MGSRTVGTRTRRVVLAKERELDMSTTTTDTGVTSVGGERLSTQSFTGRPDHGRLRIPVRRVAALLRWPGLPAVHRDLLPAGRAVLRVDPSRAEGESSPLPSGGLVALFTAVAVYAVYSLASGTLSL